MTRLLIAMAFWTAVLPSLATAEPDDSILIGLSYPRTGHYREEGLAQMRGALLAIDEINRDGGVLGKPLRLVNRDSAARPEKARRNVDSMVAEGAVMLFGSVSSAEAIAAGEQAKTHDRLYFATIGYSNDVTTEKGHRHIFRESTSATMTGRALGQYLTQHFPDKKYFYITADYNWGHTSEDSLRSNTHTTDRALHPGVTIPFPTAKQSDYSTALQQADASDADVLVLVLYGHDLVRAIRTADNMGLSRDKQIVAPNLTQSVIEQTGSSIMVGAIGAEHWLWRVPERENSKTGMAFVDNFNQKYGIYPPSAAASAYTVIHQWADAVRRSQTLNTAAVTKALENHTYSLLKGPAQWRGLDHQNVQRVYVVKVNDRSTVIQHPSKQDYFQIVHQLDGEDAVISPDEWRSARRVAGQPETLQ
ncbi:ABC transporter substrate-binding protein [Thiopseudomonas denitrificans]|uniref:Amino acid/amide ABC transporter substrate-binding protein (HAAT family) n=1 Tax=Thiopseudomonas denitrificans TaxID=1501432 RepID=A0A4R6TY39_9GAMM|nr:amino acid/amide ABC transporter substrate-binding protein (HAAT family) [Thiopseudomonas denitrificans]